MTSPKQTAAIVIGDKMSMFKAWSAKGKGGFTSSVHLGVIGKVSLQGDYISFITGQQLIGTVGIKVDAKRNILWVANPIVL